MNEVMRLLGRALRPFGYDVQKHGALNLLPAKNAVTDPSLEQVRSSFDRRAQARNSPHPNLDVVKVVFRSCLSRDRCLKAPPKINGMALAVVVKASLLSLIDSMNDSLIKRPDLKISLIVLDDDSEAEHLSMIHACLEALRCQWSLVNLPTTGQGSSLHHQFTLAKNDNALYYFCEDDYIHIVPAIYEMWSFYRQIHDSSAGHLLIHPQEHESLYKDSHGPCYLILSPFRHWRSVSNATHVLFTHSFVVRDHWECFENTKHVGDYKRRHLGSERRTTNRLFEHLPCFAPIPALAAHFQADHLLPPFFDWRALWSKYASD